MCPIEAHCRECPTINYDASSGGGRPLPSISKQYALVSFSLPLKFIENCFKPFKENYLSQTIMYFEEMRELFKKITVTIPEPKPDDYKKKIQLLLTDIGG